MKIPYSILIIFLFNMAFIQTQNTVMNQKTNQRIKMFYKRALEILSQNRTYASLSHYGMGVFANKDFKANDVVMEITPNFTISSFDSIFPYMNLVEELEPHFKTYAKEEDIHVMKMLLNLNYVRFVNNTQRFFRLYFENQPPNFDYLPFWGDEKQIFTKLSQEIIHQNPMFNHNETIFNRLKNEILEVMRFEKTGMINSIFNEDRMKLAINLINTRTFPITLKGWKVIHGKENVSEDDLNIIGKILIPGADAINHEHIIPDHPDLKLSSIINKKGKILVKAPRNFKKGEEIFINYDHFATVTEIFRKYGFVPVDSFTKSTIYDRSEVKFDKNKPYLGKLCEALRSCFGGNVTGEKITYYVPQWTNSLDIGNLNIERIQSWQDFDLSERKVIDAFNLLSENKHSNLTEGISVAKFIGMIQLRILLNTQIKTNVKTLLSMYDDNENGMDFNSIMKKHEIKFSLSKIPIDFYSKFKEFLNYSLLNWHMTALNLRSLYPMLHKSLDSLINDVKKSIMEDYSVSVDSL